jgi:hypothetical protein
MLFFSPDKKQLRRRVGPFLAKPSATNGVIMTLSSPVKVHLLEKKMVWKRARVNRPNPKAPHMIRRGHGELSSHEIPLQCPPATVQGVR